jgi:hypothetical protein
MINMALLAKLIFSAALVAAIGDAALSIVILIFLYFEMNLDAFPWHEFFHSFEWGFFPFFAIALSGVHVSLRKRGLTFRSLIKSSKN